METLSDHFEFSIFRYRPSLHVLCDMAALIIINLILSIKIVFKTADTRFVFSANVLLLYICQRSLLNIFIELTLTLFSKRGLPSGNVFLLLFLATRER